MAVERVEFNVYLSADQYSRLTRLRETGMNLSSIARLAIRKCADGPIDPEPEATSYPQRVLIYIHPDDASRLKVLATREGVSRAVILRRLLTTYLRINADAIESLI